MKKLLSTIPAMAVIAATAFAPQPAFALPTCEQEISIRCSGYNVQGRPRLDIYYDSYEECVEQETAAQCPPRNPEYGYRPVLKAVLPQQATQQG